MKTIRTMLLLVGVLWLSTALAQEKRVAFSSLPIEYQTLLSAWLSQDCRVGTEEIEANMISAGRVLEGALWEAFELGPTDDDRLELQRSLGERYALRLRWLRQNAAEAIGPASAELLRESELTFRAAEERKLIDRWRDAAVSGLGLVCTQASLGRLMAIAQDERNPSSLAGRVALETSRGCRTR
jgi:hypothetical protein